MSKEDYNRIIPTSKLEIELYLSYRDMGFNEAIVNNKVKWYELASYTIKENIDSSSKVYLHLNDFVTIQEDEYEESYAIIRGIILHKGNDKNNYVFVVVDWFENTNQEHLLLKCPFYTLQTKNWRRVFPINSIDNVQKVHFIKQKNRKWIKNNFYFTAI
jgi:hypothetical protein